MFREKENQQSRLKVLMFAYAVDNNDVGEANLTYHWITHIAKFADITLITMGSRIHDKCGLENYPGVTLKIVKPKLRFVWTGAIDQVLKLDYTELYFRARSLARKLVAKEHFDCCHHIAPHSPRYPSPLHGLGVRFIAGPVHGGLSMPESLSRNNTKSRLQKITSRFDTLRNKYDPLLKRHYSNADSLLISAPYVKESIPRAYSHKCRVIPPQPPAVLPNPPAREKSEKLRLIFVGRLIESKGIDLAVQAVARLGDTRNIVFDIYGQGELEESLRHSISKYGLNGVVNLKGQVAHEEVLREFHKHDVLLLPSLKEAWGLAVSEAMAAGLAIICINRGGPAHMVNPHSGFKIDVSYREQMIAEIADAIRSMQANRQLAARMGRFAANHVRARFTWDALMKQLKATYRGEDWDGLPVTPDVIYLRPHRAKAQAKRSSL